MNYYTTTKRFIPIQKNLPFEFLSIQKLVFGVLLFLSSLSFAQDNNCPNLSNALTTNKNVTELDLNGCSLKEIPADLNKLGDLKHLNLSRNAIKYAKFEAVSGLKHLDLSYNKLVSIHKSIDRMNDLQFLYLDHNDLTKIPERIIEASQLVTVRLNANLLKDLPEGIGGLKQLDTLELQSNQLQTLTPWIENLTNLKYPKLSSNQLLYLTHI